MPNILYFGIKWALKKHDDVIKVSGGLEGVHHINLLESALAFIKHDEYYPTFPEKITHLIYSVAKNHIFADGNKRTAIALGGYFLTINGYDELVPRYFIDGEYYSLGCDRLNDKRRVVQGYE
jgi:death-on-curing protein